jgi:hypothetical protein
LATEPDDSRTILHREWELRRDAGRVLAAALARLIEAYESNPGRARHAVSWEHLLPGKGGSPNPISERDEASAAKSSDSARRVVHASMLHDGDLSEFSQLLDDWNLIAGAGEEEKFKLDEYLSWEHNNWGATGEGLTPSERRRLQGWSVEDVERLRSRDPSLLSEYRQELEEAAAKQAEKGQDWREWEENRRIWVEARLADLETALNTKMLGARVNDLEAQRQRWEAIERMRPCAEDSGQSLRWRDIVESADSEGLTLPEWPTKVDSRFPDCLTPEMRIIYDATEEKRHQIWAMPFSREIVDEYEELVGQLAALSREMPTTPAIARYMRWNEEERISEHRSIPRLPIPIDYGWHEYYSLVLDDEANLDREIREEVLKSGNLWIYWAKELVGMLPAVTRRAVELGKHPISQMPNDRVPEGLRALFKQAHLSYLFGLEIPCTLTCGALVEEAFQVRFQEMFGAWDKEYLDGRKKGERPHALTFREKIDRVVAESPFALPARKLAIGVWDARSKAMHKPEDYLGQERYKSATILSDTRKVLKILYEPERF